MKLKRTFDRTLFDELEIDLNPRVEDSERFPDTAGNTQGVLWDSEDET